MSVVHKKKIGKKIIVSKEKKEEDIITEKKIKNSSPLRYPGGKTRACNILKKYVDENYPNRKIMLSPFFGGGSFELLMSINNYIIYGNELFLPLFNFWNKKKTDCDALVKKIKSFLPITKEKFIDFRSKIMDEKDILDMAAYYYIINRTSFSGATLCGGFSQQAADGRITDSIIEKLINCNVSNITFNNLDCNIFLDMYPEKEDTFIYADPPYYIEKYIYGKNGDMHDNFDHISFSKTLLKRKDWILSYNDCEYIRELYKSCRIYKENWSYGMNVSKKSSEIIILPPTS